MIVVSRRAALGHLIGGLAFAAMPGFAAAAGPASLVVIRLRGALESASAMSHLPENATAKAALNDLLIRLRMSGG